MAQLVADFDVEVLSSDTNFPLDVQFTDESTPAPISHWRDFGDGKKSREKNPKNVYYKEGEFDVALTVRRNTSTNKFSTDLQLGAVEVTAKTGLENMKYFETGRSGGRSYPPVEDPVVRDEEIKPGRAGGKEGGIVYF